MARNARTTITDIAAIGTELDEQQLGAISGGEPRELGNGATEDPEGGFSDYYPWCG
ncbi:hypothetical protein N5079_03320 [Planotetraspora sp. A-T 1434]|uniref:hypothetical protein n=1 Tax=Planotetraspora sp. A-T 1434 TaxID=2979219 RepID=UPI0021BF78A0|nr:hypothetical protein [Planotetraspora sp. A-T 1434]MCT9929247.1 hypothetical protein [Planotetraspora sp. A-T 1434]